MKKGSSFIWRYFPFYLVIILTSILVITWYNSLAMKKLYLDRIRIDLETRAKMMAETLISGGSMMPIDTLQALCLRLGQDLGNRFTIISPDGQVIGDSDKDPSGLENHSNRPEFKTAVSKGKGLSTRYSRTLKQNLMYVAVYHPATSSTPDFVVRASVEVSSLQETLNPLYHRIGMLALIIVLAGSLLSILISREIRKPVKALKDGAQAFGNGHLNHRIHISDPEEFTLLGNAMNRMAMEINHRMATITDQRNELQSVLSSMNEAVLVIDLNENVLRFNHAAEEYFQISPSKAQKRPIQDVIRNIDLLQFIRETINQQSACEKNIVLHGSSIKYLQAYGTILLNSKNENVGVVVVLTDYTKLRQLEGIRKDFVANVSHELKTPITAIKGSVETLRDGAFDDPETARRFLNIILKHADRLHAIVEDLLNLSRIEKMQEETSVERMTQPVKPLIEEAVLLCRAAAVEKQVALEVNIQNALSLYCHGDMIQQALINLIDNAIKYSGSGSTINISAAAKSDHVIISIADQGQGIPEEHMTRLFERFYRVDASRSREQGGTGLGLSIVKHIMQVHQGQIEVDSTVGQGSTFRLIFTHQESSSPDISE